MSGVLDALPALAMAYACQISTPTLWNEMYQPTRGRMLLLYLYALGGALYDTPFTVTAMCCTIPLLLYSSLLRCLLHYQAHHRCDDPLPPRGRLWVLHLWIASLEAECGFMSPNQRSRGHAFRRIRSYSAVLTVFAPLVLPRCSEDAAQVPSSRPHVGVLLRCGG